MFHLFLLVYLSLFFSFKNADQPLKSPHSPQPPAPSTASQPTFLSKVQQNVYKVAVKTQQQCKNISILLWQNVSVLL